MHRLSLLLFFLSALFAHSGQTTFHGTSLDTSFAVAGEIAGKVSVKSNKVTVTITRGHLVRQPCGETKDRKVTQISAFLADWTEDRRTFRYLVFSRPLKIDRIIAVGETISLDGEKFEIPTDKLSRNEMKRAWLAFSIVDELPPKDGKTRAGTCYIHTIVSLTGDPTGFPPKRETTAN